MPWTSQNKLVINKIQSLFFELIFYYYIKIKELNEELNLKNEELDSFSYTLSHDLGTPLTVIKLNLQQLYIKLKDQEDDFNKIKTILDQISNMENLMQNILNISRLRTTDIIYEEVDMNHLINRIIEDCIKVYGINTKVDLDLIPNIKEDKTLIYQVFQNVISNAVKYSSEGIKPFVKIKGTDEPNYTIYTISDNGIGIPENQINDLFKIFKRLDNAKTYQGNGVGLAIVNRIMNRLNGKIEVINNQKRGTTFKLYF